MRLYRWKATYSKVKLIGIVFATNVDNAFMITNQRLCDNGYEQKDLVSLKCKEINIKPTWSTFHIICKRKIRKKKNDKK